MKKVLILPVVIVILLIIIIFEAGILLSRKQTATISSRAATQSPVKKPEQEGRQAIYISETNGLEFASATLVYKGSVLSLTQNDASQIAKLTMKIVGVEEQVDFYFDPAIVTKTTVSTEANEEKLDTFEEMQELIKIGDTIRIIYDYNILNNTVNSIKLEML